MKEMQDRYIRFDWAIKRLLRQKANFDVLEGFLTVFLGEKITIVELLESKGNQLSADDKFNRVDIKALNSKGEIIIIDSRTERLQFEDDEYYYYVKAVPKAVVSGTNKQVKRFSGKDEKERLTKKRFAEEMDIDEELLD